MFSGCTSLNTVDLNVFDFSKVEKMDSMFYDCINLRTIIPLNKLVQSSVKSMTSMFIRCKHLKSFDFTNFKTPSLTNMKYMFSDC